MKKRILNKVLFLYLSAFGITGGIEKFNRSMLKALHELSVDGIIDAGAISVYDALPDERYFTNSRFRGCRGTKYLFVLNAILCSFKYKTVIIGHINLATVAFLIKKLNPSVRLITIAHGIEVWRQLSWSKRWLLEKSDLVLAVSNFTRDKIAEYNSKVLKDRILVFPNTLDPYFVVPSNFKKPEYLMRRYGIPDTMNILLTVTRLASNERYKGYDTLIKLMPQLLSRNKEFGYIICGKGDKEEIIRIEAMTAKSDSMSSIKLVGFIPDSELTDHYLLADIYVMVSKGEGFGIVFIEALACGRRVIAGSMDGSVDALLNGELGKLVDPDNEEEILKAIGDSLYAGQHDPYSIQKLTLETFGFPKFKQRLCEHLGLSTL